MKPLLGPIALALALLFAALGVGQCSGRVTAEHARDKAQAAFTVADANRKACEANVGNLQASLVAQNLAVDALKREGEARLAESRKATQAARAVAESRRRETQALLQAKPASADHCASARAFVNEEDE